MPGEVKNASRRESTDVKNMFTPFEEWPENTRKAIAAAYRA
jgi:hypothetical protein